jgi:hypothetical protein
VVRVVRQPRAATVSTAVSHTSGRAELSNIKVEKPADILVGTSPDLSGRQDGSQGRTTWRESPELSGAAVPAVISMGSFEICSED